MMSKVSYFGVRVHQAVAAKVIALAPLLFFLVLPAHAAQSSAPFALTINLQSPDTGICRSSTKIGSFGSAVTVICSTGAITSFSGNTLNLPAVSPQDSSYRYVTNVSSAGVSLGTIESYVGESGTVTSWRVVNLANRDYLELTVHW